MDILHDERLSTPLRKRSISPQHDSLTPAPKRRRKAIALSVGIIEVNDIDMSPARTPQPSPLPLLPFETTDPSPSTQPQLTRLKRVKSFDFGPNTPSPLQTPDRFIKPKLVPRASPSHQPLKVTPRTRRLANLAASILPAVDLQANLRLAAQSLYSPPQHAHPLSAATHASSTFYRSLDAPNMSTDHWRTLLDWGPGDVKAVALGNHLYAQTPHSVALVVSSLFPTHHHINTVQLHRSNHTTDAVAFGTTLGFVQVSTLHPSPRPTTFWMAPNPSPDRSIGISDSRTIAAHSLDWNGPLLCVGYDGGLVTIYDTRIKAFPANQRIHQWKGHRSSTFVAGVKWKDDGYTIASSGTDSLVMGWDMRSNKPNAPLWKINDFKGGVKVCCAGI